ncbi:MAG: protein-glutamate O-methyltransferase CheR [Alicyclobacillaceae bacterium]|nr:protein-glutamate O-methyltransferase CheR [Alicyclobacillaceae bacterium]
MAKDEYSWFAEQLYRWIGVDLHRYKRPQMERRLNSVRQKWNCGTWEEFFELLKRDRQVYQEFLDKMTINVSEFYRNPGRWEVIAKDLVPRYLGTSRKIRCWSAACSTGEEPYTLAIVFLEGGLSPQRFDILATDIDETAMERAKAGVYRNSSLESVPEEVKRKYFKRLGDDRWEVQPVVKQSVTFRRHNLLADPFEKGFDLIVCRNVMIYFTEDAKTELYRKFWDSLVPGGILFVGSTEPIFQPERYGFRVFSTFFYEKSDLTPRS